MTQGPFREAARPLDIACPDMPDHLEAERFSPLGATPLEAIVLGAPGAARHAARLAASTQAIVIGVDHDGALPVIDPAPFDCLLTTASDPSAPWVHTPSPARWLHAAEARVRAAPIAAATALRVLRINERLPIADALTVESIAYSTLLGGEEFRRWRRAHRPRSVAPAADPGAPIAITRERDRITITLARPATRNAMTAALRDALWDALAAVLDDPSGPSVTLRGAGDSFSTGGDLAEFGTARDLARAHAIRTARSCAGLLFALGDRVTAVLHGACIGSGIEVAAAAARRRACPGAFFQLPELGMGLMPGAGGTVSLPRAIGRHRTAAMLLAGRRVPARTALAWGLIDAIEPSP